MLRACAAGRIQPSLRTALLNVQRTRSAVSLVGLSHDCISRRERRAIRLALHSPPRRHFLSWPWSRNSESSEPTSPKPWLWKWSSGGEAGNKPAEPPEKERGRIRTLGSEDDPTLTRELLYAKGDSAVGGLHGMNGMKKGENCSYTLEEVMSRSVVLRGGSEEEPFADPGQRAFLALNAMKLNSRIYLGRPLEADYTFVRNSRGKPKVLGHGMSGPVRAVKRRVDDRVCAVKSFQKSRLDERQSSMLRNEAQIFLEVDHPNIVRLMGCYEDDDELHFVMELCSGGEVYKELLKRHHYMEPETADIVRQMLFALLYLHENSLVHRDLKLENWMFEDDNRFARVKLIDFGLSRIWDPEEVGSMSRSCGTVNYMAPEVLENKYDHKADLWSLGVIVFMLLSGKAPFYAESCDGFTKDVVASSIREGVYEYSESEWKDVSPEARDFVEQLLQHDVSKRMDAHQALAHPWLQQARKAGVEANTSRELAKVDDNMIEGWQRFASFSAPMRVMLVELAYASRWTEGFTHGLQELFAEKSQHRGTMDFTTFRELVLEADTRISLDYDEIDDIFSAIASSRGGAGALSDQICYSEFLASVLPGRFRQDELVEELFKMIDINRDRRVSANEFMAVLGGTVITEEETKEFLSSFDGDGDGLITLSEFSKALSSKHFAKL